MYSQYIHLSSYRADVFSIAIDYCQIARISQAFSTVTFPCLGPHRLAPYPQGHATITCVELPPHACMLREFFLRAPVVIPFAGAKLSPLVQSGIFRFSVARVCPFVHYLVRIRIFVSSGAFPVPHWQVSVFFPRPCLLPIRRIMPCQSGS